jgi:selenocysteine-specific elongation factor
MGAHVARTDFQIALPAGDAALWERIRPLLAAGGAEPPRVVELADQLNVPRADVTQALTATARFGLAHPVAANRFYLPSGLRRLAEVAKSLDGGEGFQAAEFRDASGLGRNLVIEVLEYFDACGLTQRDGNIRTMIADATVIFPDGAEDIGQDMDTPSEAG